MSSSKTPFPSSDRLKRSRDITSSNAAAHPDRPTKKAKLGHDRLRDHLPEVQNFGTPDRQDTHDWAEFRKAALESSKKRNTIVFLPEQTAVEFMHYDFIQWSVDIAKAGRKPTDKNTFAVFVVEKDTSIEAHARYISAKLNRVSCFPHVSVKLNKEALQSDVLVATSKRLFEALSRGKVKMHGIHSLIIEDAQYIRTQGCHSFIPIIQVINTFYRTTPTSARPRVLAIAFSSNNAPEQYDLKTRRLEQALDAETYGVSDERRAEILEIPDRPNETIVLYDEVAEHKPARSHLYKRLLRLDPGMKSCRKYFRAAETAAEKLGSCASDLIWRAASKEIEASVPTWYEDDGQDSPHSIRIRIRDTIQHWTFAMPNLNPGVPGFNVTHKFLRLIQVLESGQSYGEEFRGIIFVQHRQIAYALAEVLRMLNDTLPFIRAIGVSGNLDFTSQQEMFSKFASGKHNLMVATKSVEDLGIPNASVVIRYDLFDSQISLAHARACTLGRESQLVHLIERNNDQHRQALSRSSSHSPGLLQWMDTFHRTPRIAVPPQGIKPSPQTYQSDSEDDGEDETYILHPVTGGRIYPEDAIAVLINLVPGLLQSHCLEHEQPMFDFKLIPGHKLQLPLFTCSIDLPGTEIDATTGPSAPNQYLARRLTSFEACKRLLALGMLDYQVVPLSPSLPLPVSGLEELDAAKVVGTRRYPQKQPIFWSNKNAGPVSLLYPTILSIESDHDRFSPLVLLTRQPLPPFLKFNLFLDAARMSVISSRAAPLQLGDDKVALLRRFTLRIFRSILNKPLDCELNAMTYLLAPLLPSWRAEPSAFQLQKLDPSVDWILMGDMEDKWAMPIQTDSVQVLKEDLSGAVMQDRWLEFTRRYHVVKIREDMSPLSKPGSTEREADFPSYLAFVHKNRKEFPGLNDNNQSLVQVDKVSSLVNNLNPKVKDITPPSKSGAKFLIPELCYKFVLPSSLLRTALLLPSIMCKVDEMLLVKEMNNMFFDNAIREDLLSEALTTISAGMERDYERLELLGDSFLKYFATIFVFVTSPTQNEGSLHISRQKLISNKALLQASVRVGVPPYIRSLLFVTKSWNPPNYVTLALTSKDKTKSADMEVLEGPTATKDSSGNVVPSSIQTSGKTEASLLEKGNPKDGSKPSENKKKAKKAKKVKRLGEENGVFQSLGDKAIADVAEAIVGAAYISGGRECALKVLKTLTLPLPGINSWSDFGSRVVIPSPHTMAQLQPDSIKAVEKIIGHSFREPHLLAQAMTHSSAQANGATYERLEFLGDAILDFMVIRHIYDRDHTLSPGGLTLLKSAMVSNNTLAAICVSSGLQKHLLFESHQLSDSIQEYASMFKQKAEEEYRDAEENQRPPGQFWAGIEPPKALSDVVEAIIGAVYISDNFSPVGAEAFFDNVLRPFFDKHITLQTLSHHPTKTLFELIQAHGCQAMKITKDPKCNGVITCHGDGVNIVRVHEETLATGSGATPTSAARNASVLAMEVIKENASVLSKKCDCRGRPRDKNSWMAQGFKDALSSLIEEHSDERETVFKKERGPAKDDLIGSQD